MFHIDHLAIGATDLATGAEAIATALGVPLDPGGVHVTMGTHNRLLSLGPREYLEVIAIDPAAAAPARPRWFGLDAFAGAPRPVAWVLAGTEIEAGLALAPPGVGAPVALSRGDLRWELTIPDDGQLPFGGVFPALIRWDGPAHPAARLPDRGVRLTGITLHHPEVEALRTALAPLIRDTRVTVEAGDAPRITFAFSTPAGPRVLA